VNIVLLEERDRVEGDAFELSGRRACHVLSVLGATAGDTLRVGLVDGPLGEAVVVAAGEDAVTLECRFDDAPPPRPLTDLLLAVPRPKSLRKLLPEIAALGVDRLTLLRTWRVHKPYLTARILRPEAQRPLLLDGLMQARCTRVPRVSVEPLFKPFVEDRAPELFAGARRLVFHPAAARRLASVEIGADERVALAVGPEGGFLPYEVEKLEAAGFAAVTLGGRTLRVETACVVALGVVAALRS
jgi:RsmE family RNA methyltransferase